MRCLLIHDPEADKSGAAVDVKVGCSLDPKPLYGTAHFLEHMLFQGTEKYPKENEYSEFMQNNGGMNNAFTSLTNTNYHFDCSNDGFEEGLDRLAQFFISPKFSESSAEREVKAVDSEFNMSL
jgi:insulysin